MSYKKSILWMLASLFLLGIFLTYYLCGAYKNEENRLEREAKYLFSNAIKDIEGTLLTKMIFIQLDTILDHEHIKNDDSTTTIINIEAESLDVDFEEDDDSAGIKIIHKSIEKRTRLDSGKIVIDLIETNDQFKRTPSIDSILKGDYKVLLKAKFDENLNDADLKLDYSLLVNDSLNTKSPLQWLQNKDLQTEKIESSLLIEHQPSTILKNIIADVLVALFLFLSISSAFYILLRSIKKERALLDIKNDFIQNMTHELKTPISTLNIALEATNSLKESNAIKSNEYLEIAQQQGNKLTFIIDKVLSVFLLEEGRPNSIIDPFELNKLLTTILHSFELNANEKSIKLSTSLEGEIPMLADRQMVSLIFHNLIDNAIKYQIKERGGTVSIASKACDNKVEIEIKDNGPGISELHQKRIFEKFYRIPKGEIHDVKGHGLGLYFVKKMVENMGGEIRLDSNEAGSTFKVIIQQSQV